MTLSLRNVMRSARLTPPFSASTAISASVWATMPSIRLWQIFTSRARSPSPTYVTPAPKSWRYGSGRANASRGPEATIESLPAATTLGLPLTGAARTAVPCSCAASRTTCDAPGEIVVESTRTLGAVPSRESRPPSPMTTCWKSRSPPTMVKTMSRSARSAGGSTIVAPCSASGSAFARVRFHTATSCPASSRRLASANPMRPAPIHPSRIPFSSLICSPVACKRLQDGIADRCGRQGSRRGRRASAETGASGAPPASLGSDPQSIAQRRSAMGIHTYGSMGVDWEERVRFDRLREERLQRIKAQLEASELGALLCFDMTNIRYVTATHIGTWAQDKLNRFCLLPRGEEPIMWDFGSAARHHQLYNPWLGEGRSRAGISTMRGAMSPQSGRAEDVAEKIRVELEQRGLLNEPVGIDAIEPPVLFALQAAGIDVVDGQQLMQAARIIKTEDEITLLNMACGMVDAAYEDLYRAMRPGMRENECVGLVSKVLYDLGSEHVEGVNAISGERCSPHPHVYTDRMLRPGDPAYFDVLHSYMGYRTCYYRTFAIGSASNALVDAYARCRDILDRAISMIRPGVTTAEVVETFPRAEEFGFPDEEAAFALQYGHGVGLSIWEKPIFSRLVSLDHPEVIEEGMFFALETYWPSADGVGAARIEEELVVTATGCEVVTKSPAEELLVPGHRYFSLDGHLPLLRNSQSHLNTPEGRGER